jgi:DNA-binding CsgD family transcriptional regulator
MTSTTLSTARADAVLDMLAMLSGPLTHDEFCFAFVEHTCRILRADRGSTVELPVDGLGDGVAWPARPPSELADVFFRRSDEHPSVIALRQHANRCHRLREQYSLRQLGRMSIYQDFMRPMGCSDQLAISFAIGNFGMVAMSIARIDGEFTEGDRELMDRLAGPVRHLYRAARNGPHHSSALSDREDQVIRLVSAGHTDRMIGRLLGVSQRTVEKHLEAVRAKLHVSSRAAAVATWLRTSPAERYL